MNFKTIAAVALTVAASASFSMEVNKQAMGDSGVDFVQKVDDQMGGYVRALRRGSQANFDALSLTMFMNQTANIEKKLDILIAETRKNNKLLAMQTKSSSQLIELMKKVGAMTNKAPAKG